MILQDFSGSSYISSGGEWEGTLTPQNATTGIQLKLDPIGLQTSQFHALLEITVNYTVYDAPVNICYVVWKNRQVGEIANTTTTSALNSNPNIAAFYYDSEVTKYPGSAVPEPHQIVRRGYCTYQPQGTISEVKSLDNRDVVYANYTYEFLPPFKVTDEQYENATYLSDEFIKNVHIYNFYNPGGYIPTYSSNRWSVSDSNSGKYDNPDLYRTATGNSSNSQLYLQMDDNVLRRPAMYAVFGDPYNGFRLKNIMRWSQGRSDYYYFGPTNTNIDNNILILGNGFEFDLYESTYTVNRQSKPGEGKTVTNKRFEQSFFTLGSSEKNALPKSVVKNTKTTAVTTDFSASPNALKMEMTANNTSIYTGSTGGQNNNNNYGFYNNTQFNSDAQLAVKGTNEILNKFALMRTSFTLSLDPRDFPYYVIYHIMKDDDGDGTFQQKAEYDIQKFDHDFYDSTQPDKPGMLALLEFIGSNTGTPPTQGIPGTYRAKYDLWDRYREPNYAYKFYTDAAMTNEATEFDITTQYDEDVYVKAIKLFDISEGNTNNMDDPDQWKWMYMQIGALANNNYVGAAGKAPMMLATEMEVSPVFLWAVKLNPDKKTFTVYNRWYGYNYTLNMGTNGPEMVEKADGVEPTKWTMAINNDELVLSMTTDSEVASATDDSKRFSKATGTSAPEDADDATSVKFYTQEMSTALSSRGTSIDGSWTHVTDAGKLEDNDPYHFHIDSESISDLMTYFTYGGDIGNEEVAYQREIALTNPDYYTHLDQNNTYRVRFYDSSNDNTETALGDKKKVKMYYLETVSNDPTISNGTVTPTGEWKFSKREITENAYNDSIYLTKGGYIAWMEPQNAGKALPYATITNMKMQGVDMSVKVGDATKSVSALTVYPWSGSQVLLLATTESGDYYLKFNDENAPATMAVSSAAMDNNARFFIDYATKFKVPLNYMKNIGDEDYSWGTVCVPFDMKIKQDGQNSAKAYTVQEVKKEEGQKAVLQLTEVTGETLTAGTPYILRSTVATNTLLGEDHPNRARNVEMQVLGSSTGAAASAGSTNGTGVELRGQYLRFKVQGSASDEDIIKESDKYYTLGTGGGKGIGFYPYAHQDKQYSIGPNKAYIYNNVEDGAAGANMMTMMIIDELLENGEMTVIDAVDAASEGGDWYTIEGMKVAKPTKRGIYIRNGKKVIVK